MANVLTYLPKVETFKRKQTAYQGVVKRDWAPTGRIDFVSMAIQQGLMNQANSSCS